ncbi:MAG: alpha/beta fold hydrolase [Erysipelotrichaceae bacterium]
MRKQFQLTSDQDGLLLDGLLYACDAPKGIVQIAHGMAEHKERYIPFMEFLNQQGYVALIHDHRGHGASVKEATDLGYFYDGSARFIVEDLHQVATYAKSLFPGVPHFIFAHSMGTLVTRCFLQRYDAEVDGVILSGAVAFNPLVGPSLFLNRTLQAIYGDRHRSKFLDDLAFKAYSKKFKEPTPFNWLNSDAAQVALYEQDPLCGNRFTLDGFLNLSLMVKRAYQSDLYEMNNPSLPLLFLAGSDDPVIDGAKGFAKEIDFIKQCGYRQVAQQLYPGLRHEILLEREHQRVFEDVLAFLENHTISV